jgi:hypothetical protein
MADDEIRVWSIGGMILTGENEVLGEKHYTASFCLPQIPHGRAWDRTHEYVMTPTSWVMAQPHCSLKWPLNKI